MEKILVAGDTHGDVNHLRHLIAVAKRHDCPAVFVLGDFGFWAHFKTGVEFLDHLDKHAGRENVLVYFLDGNHDKTSLVMSLYSHDRDAEGFVRVRDNVLYAPRGHRWTWAGTRFITLGGAFSVDKDYRLEKERLERRGPGTYWFPEEEMTDEDMATFLLDNTPVDIMLAHDKPHASNPGWNRKNILECSFNQHRLQMAVHALEPQLFLHGHLHYRYTDHIRVTADTWCRVEAFTPNPEAAERGYRREDSRAVLHIAEKRIEEIP